MSSHIPFIVQLTHPDNLYWSWNKAKRQYRQDRIWFDEIELAAFEANLEKELESIASDFKKQCYKLRLIKPLPFPKTTRGEGHKARQLFWVSVRDQVAWISLINILGPNLDCIMPTWSYGNRLYRPVWIEEESGQKAKKIGWYRHTSGNIYRKFQHSWPLFRRHILLTIKKMSSQTVYIDPASEEIEELERTLPSDLKLIYLKDSFWRSQSNDLYWASIDFAKFYPSIKHQSILENINKFLMTFGDKEKLDILTLAKRLLAFRIDLDSWEHKELAELELGKFYGRESPRFPGIPTGLFVAHFLANIAMLNVDKQLDCLVKNSRTIAHFRYVDDHVVLAPSFEQLAQWIDQYQKILDQSRIGVKVNKKKSAPEAFRKYMISRNKEKCEPEARKETKLDPRYPKPLMTETLTQVSNIARTRFELLDIEEQKHLLDELEHLMLADFHDDEIREDTRLSFAASKIAKLAPQVTENYIIRAILEEEITELKKNVQNKNSYKNIKDVKKEGEVYHKYIDHLKRRLEEFNVPDDQNKDFAERNFKLLVKAIHEYPDKLPLWHFALEYCRAVGIDSLEHIKDEISYYFKLNSFTCSYVLAFLRLVLSHHIIECSKIILDKDTNPQEQDAATKHLVSIIDLIKKQSFLPNKKKYYEIISDDLLGCALGTAEILLERSGAETSLSQKIKIVLAKLKAADHMKLIWSKPDPYWDKDPIHNLSSWAWWAESLTNDSLKSSPGHVWALVADRLSINQDACWSFWLRYPKHLSENIVNQIIANKNKLYDYFNVENLGYIYDIAAETRHQGLANELKIFGIVIPISEAGDYITLYDWAKYTRDLHSKMPHDPRVSEWTSLFIVEKCIELLLTPSLFNKGFREPNLSLIHPANYLIPKEWRDSKKDGKYRSWEEWQSEVSGNDKTIILAAESIGDQRLNPYWKALSDIELDLAPVRGMAMILLGLLRRSFDWPNVWNPKGLRRAYDTITRRLISNIVCSSRTRAIMEACLLWRPKETYDFEGGLFAQVKPLNPKDTLAVLPSIKTLTEMSKHTEIARQVLKKYQVSVHGNMPRQLIPIHLEPIKEENWFLGEDS